MARMAHGIFVACAAILFLGLEPARAALNIQSVTVGNQGNAADGNGRGSVSYTYRMASYEVTNAQYVEFLNAKAASDPLELYDAQMGSDAHGGIVRSGSAGNFSYAIKAAAQSGTYNYANKPVVFVTWYDTIRFTNWLHNGQGSGSTETGSYTLLGGTPTPSNGNSITRNVGASWVLPTDNEWYKSAYHKNDGVTGNYWDYPTRSDTEPNNNLPSNDTGNSANFVNSSGNWTLGPTFSLTDVGAYTISEAPYNTFDQAGNVYEWTENLSNATSRIARGGSWNHFAGDLRFSAFREFSPTLSSSTVGFRVASVPEPGPFLLCALTALALTWRRLAT